jgi:hypothetical protein
MVSRHTSLITQQNSSYPPNERGVSMKVETNSMHDHVTGLLEELSITDVMHEIYAWPCTDLHVPCPQSTCKMQEGSYFCLHPPLNIHILSQAGDCVCNTFHFNHAHQDSRAGPQCW